ncbi:MAG: Rid family detoxifying hydrolase [Actinomycetota bacterium]|nr:Rid family detoxifying hydrolase [Actinomycetota bacterium]
MSSPVGPYSPVFRAGEWLVTSGQIGVRDGSLIGGGVREQARQALANVRHLLEGQGASMSDVVKTTVFMVHIGDYGPLNEVYAEAFAEHRPARSAVAVSALPLGALVEIEAWART